MKVVFTGMAVGGAAGALLSLPVLTTHDQIIVEIGAALCFAVLAHAWRRTGRGLIAIRRHRNPETPVPDGTEEGR